MTKPEHDRLTVRMLRIELQLQWIAECRVSHGAPAELEERLLDEQEDFEYRLGVDWFEQRDGGSHMN